MGSSIRKGLLQFVFSGAYMKRWNDKLRPMEFIEVDKQAHKMLVAWILCRLSGETMPAEERLKLEEEVVEGGIFDYLFRLVITDIKPPVLYRIKENTDHYRQLVHWGIKEVEAYLRPLDAALWQRFQNYIMHPQAKSQARDILHAAHTYASLWEFRLIKKLNEPFDDEVQDVEARLEAEIESYAHLPGMGDFINGQRRIKLMEQGVADSDLPPLSALASFANLCGQLRFQKRWSQTPRIPETSVMGHMFIVACFAYFVSVNVGSCTARRVNAFYCGLLHDLPELLTRDIIAPVKKSFEELDQLIKEYERDELERRVLGRLESAGYKNISDRLRFYLGLAVGSEFYETILRDELLVRVNFTELQQHYNEDKYDPKDGAMIKYCDVLSAYIEAYAAMRNGTASEQIQQAFWRLREQNAKAVLGPLHIGALFTDFD